MPCLPAVSFLLTRLTKAECFKKQQVKRTTSEIKSATTADRTEHTEGLLLLKFQLLQHLQQSQNWNDLFLMQTICSTIITQRATREATAHANFVTWSVLHFVKLLFFFCSFSATGRFQLWNLATCTFEFFPDVTVKPFSHMNFRRFQGNRFGIFATAVWPTCSTQQEIVRFRCIHYTWNGVRELPDRVAIESSFGFRITFSYLHHCLWFILIINHPC